MITIGGKDIADIVIDNKNVVKVQDANTLEIMWEKTTPVVVDYFYIENTYSGSNTLSVTPTLDGSPTSGTYTTTLEYSKDKTNWTTINLVAGTPSTISMSQGEKVYFRNNNGKFSYCESGNSYVISFGCTESHNAGGNVNTLLDYTSPNSATLGQGCFDWLFYYDTTLEDVSNIVLPSTTLAAHCYRSMFNGCSSLTDASFTLPATTMTESCYRFMFRDCSSLTSAPTLSGTTLYTSCYQQMFQNCTSLTSAPALNATTLANSCYQGMFNGCTSLVNPPTLPATTLVSSCYRQMFYNCSSLNYINVYANSNSASNCIDNWLYGVASTGTFNNYGSASYTYPSASGIPQGWSEVSYNEYFYIENAYNGSNTLSVKTDYNGTFSGNTYATSVEYSKDKINWTTLNLVADRTSTISMSQGEKVYFRNDSGYFNTVHSGIMNEYYATRFYADNSINCGGNLKSLLNYRNMENVSLPIGCYSHLFHSSNISDASKLVINSVSERCCDYMFTWCTNLISPPTLPTTTLSDYCYYRMFSNSNITSTPTLYATTLATGCYEKMFYGCTSLTTVSTLPATILTNSCYQSMFYGCTSLVTAPNLPALTIENSSYKQMFQGCTSLLNPPIISATSLNVSSCNEMFRGCTSLTTAPTLFSTTLVLNCYYQMFYNCSSLNSVTTYAIITGHNSSDYITRWLYGVAATGTFHNLGSATYPSGASGIPSGWTEVHS